jgi:tRNA A-37 threonylcarbamoyl transferase component Bud32
VGSASEQAATPDPLATVYPPPTAAGASLPVLGEYELLERLGTGGMGEVYKARHRRLNKLVALKLLRMGARGSVDSVGRFLREMRAVGGLDHPNVVEAHDAGEQGGVVFLVMKLVEGTDLQQLVRQRGPLPVAEACDLARQTALGLQHIHERGLVHRDMKPSNLMCLADGTLKILDLGLARWRTEAAAGGELTEAGQVLGTPDYLAPEQVDDAAAVDIRADLYGLGGTLFYLLTGQPPFAQHSNLFAKLEAHRCEPPADVRTERPEVPEKLARLIGRLLAKRPEDRPRTPAEVAAELATFTERTALLDPVAPPTLEAMPPRRAGRRAWWLAGAAAGLVAAGLAALLVFGLRHPWRQAPPDNEGTDTPVANDGPASDHHDPAGDGRGPHAPHAGKVRVLRLDVQHFANVGGRSEQLRGVLGRDSFQTHRGDSVTVEARLSRPAYAYLIAFRPDGTEELCFPESEDEPPSRTDRPRYPSGRGNDEYGLDEGEGLQVFAVVVSDQPLPAYRVWRARRGPSPWKPAGTPAGVVWRDDGRLLEGLTANPGDLRGKGKEGSGRTPMARLTDWLRRAPHVQAVTAVGFAVLPRDGAKK